MKAFTQVRDVKETSTVNFRLKIDRFAEENTAPQIENEEDRWKELCVTLWHVQCICNPYSGNYGLTADSVISSIEPNICISTAAKKLNITVIIEVPRHKTWYTHILFFTLYFYSSSLLSSSVSQKASHIVVHICDVMVRGSKTRVSVSFCKYPERKKGTDTAQILSSRLYTLFHHPTVMTKTQRCAIGGNYQT